jgi:hypothetical protein
VFFLIPVIGLATIVLGTVSLIGGLVDSTGRFPHRCAQWWAWWILTTTGVRRPAIRHAERDLRVESRQLL